MLRPGQWRIPSGSCPPHPPKPHDVIPDGAATAYLPLLPSPAATEGSATHRVAHQSIGRHRGLPERMNPPLEKRKARRRSRLCSGAWAGPTAGAARKCAVRAGGHRVFVAANSFARAGSRPRLERAPAQPPQRRIGRSVWRIPQSLQSAVQRNAQRGRSIGMTSRPQSRLVRGFTCTRRRSRLCNGAWARPTAGAARKRAVRAGGHRVFVAANSFTRAGLGSKGPGQPTQRCIRRSVWRIPQSLRSTVQGNAHLGRSFGMTSRPCPRPRLTHIRRCHMEVRGNGCFHNVQY
jgi:hypothetical protein